MNSLKIEIGEKVFLIHSGEMGVVKQFIYPYSVLVDVDGEIISVHKTAILPAKEFGVAEGAEKNDKMQTESFNIKEADGVALVFKAVKNSAGEVVRFEVYLVNNTEEDIFAHYVYYLYDTAQNKTNKIVHKNEPLFLHEFKTDKLNENPIFIFKFDGGGEKNIFEKEIKLKPKNFFSKLESDIFKNKGYIIFNIIKNIPSLKNVREIEPEEIFYEGYEKNTNKVNEIIKKSEMPDYIDLHIEKLEKQHTSLSASEILHIQLRKFRNFLELAIRYNLHKIYAVHGIGKGILKQEVEKILMEYPEVISFNNDYTGRFGFGATAIFLEV